MLGVGQVHVFPGWGGLSFLLLLVVLGFHSGAVLMSQHGVQQFLSYLGGFPFHCGVGGGAWSWGLAFSCKT